MQYSIYNHILQESPFFQDAQSSGFVAADVDGLVGLGSTLTGLILAHTVLSVPFVLLTVGVNFVVDWFLHKTSGLRE